MKAQVLKKIIIPGNPVPLKRHRHTLSGKTYNPQRKLMEEMSFIIKSQICQRHHPAKFYTNPLTFSAIFHMPIPKSYPKAKKEKINGKHHFSRPDLDNYIKLYLDVIVYAGIIHDDSQISIINANKIYSKDPRTEIILEILDE